MDKTTETQEKEVMTNIEEYAIIRWLRIGRCFLVYDLSNKKFGGVMACR